MSILLFCSKVQPAVAKYSLRPPLVTCIRITSQKEGLVLGELAFPITQNSKLTCLFNLRLLRWLLTRAWPTGEKEYDACAARVEVELFYAANQDTANTLLLQQCFNALAWPGQPSDWSDRCIAWGRSALTFIFSRYNTLSSFTNSQTWSYIDHHK